MNADHKETIIYGERGANISFRILRYALMSCIPLLAVCAYMNNYFVLLPVLFLLVSRYMTAKYWQNTPYVVFKDDLFTIKPSKMVAEKSIPYDSVVRIEEQKRAWVVNYSIDGKERQLVIVRFWLTPAGEDTIRAEFERYMSSVVIDVD
ncbi:hypothetical protein [Marinomonas spartinae]|uniref:hypothetical protein n=1 Tax=Marinomonas spartinae TaxID=1792290 RepID=UPI0018F2351D|nr:hypothetical protein [Marinomonas spartinae]MBJ7554832.1 hypothetical protein [Marinomonas spartinae]